MIPIFFSSLPNLATGVSLSHHLAVLLGGPFRSSPHGDFSFLLFPISF